MSWLIDHWFYAFLVWTAAAVAVGYGFCKVVAYADHVELPQPEQVGTDTVLIDWADRPASWL